MKLPPDVEKALASFDRMSMRERALVAAAVTVALLMIWTIALMDPLTAKSNALSSEIASLQETRETSVEAAAQAEVSDTSGRLLEREKKLTARLASVNEQLTSRSTGLIPPERMVEVIHDVLGHQRGITLVSLQNKPVVPLIPPAAATESTPAENNGPYVHGVALIIEGNYLDIVRYLHALEALPWQFHWRSLELKTTEYPRNRVQIELSTLSLDKNWIGV